MAWPEKEKKKTYFCVMFNHYNAVDHLTGSD